MLTDPLSLINGITTFPTIKSAGTFGWLLWFDRSQLGSVFGLVNIMPLLVGVSKLFSLPGSIKRSNKCEDKLDKKSDHQEHTLKFIKSQKELTEITEHFVFFLKYMPEWMEYSRP